MVAAREIAHDEFLFADAEKAYAAAVEASPGDFGACFEQAYFLASLNRRQPATQGYLRCLAIGRAGSDLDQIAMTLNNLGILHRDQNRMDEARKAYEEALGTYRQLARANPDTYSGQAAVAQPARRIHPPGP